MHLFRLANQSVRAQILLVATCSYLISGCGPSYEEKEKQRKDELQKQQQQERTFIEDISRKYDAMLFPPADVKDNLFTYELQRILKGNTGRPILFRGYLEDIEEVGNGVIVEFSSSINGGIGDITGSSIVLFRLEASPAQTEVLIGETRTDPLMRQLRFLLEPDYLVVAKIQNMARARRYEFRGYSYGEEDVEIEVETPPTFVSAGELIDIIRFPKHDERSENPR